MTKVFYFLSVIVLCVPSVFAQSGNSDQCEVIVINIKSKKPVLLGRFKTTIAEEELDGVREIKAGGGKRTKVEAKSHVVRVRMKSGLSQAQFAAALGVSKRTLEQWEQGRREPSGAAKQLLKIAELHPEVLLEVAA